VNVRDGDNALRSLRMTDIQRIYNQAKQQV